MTRIVTPTPSRPSIPSRRATTTRRNSFTDDEDAITPCSSPPPEPNQPTAFATFEEQQEIGISTSSSSRPSPSPSSNNKRPASPRFMPSRRGSASYHNHHHASAAPSRKTSTSTAAAEAAVEHFDPTDGEPLSDAQLWRRMLAIQQEFHCYNSARMSAALLGLEMGVDVGQLAPSRKCLDLINESMSDLNPEEKQRLTEWVHENSCKRKRSSIWRRSTASVS